MPSREKRDGAAYSVVVLLETRAAQDRNDPLRWLEEVGRDEFATANPYRDID